VTTFIFRSEIASAGPDVPDLATTMLLGGLWHGAN
jgi:hypothetical protein